MIVIVDDNFLRWFYDLLGQISDQSSDASLAVEYYKETIGIDDQFYLAYINWATFLLD